MIFGEARLRPFKAALALATLIAGLPRATTAAAPADAEGVEFFERNIRPLLVEHCYECHSAEAKKVRGGLLLDVKKGWTQGGESGKPAIVPGDPDASPLIQAVRHASKELAMPPRQKLPAEAIAALEEWVRMGAPDPREGDLALADPAELAKDHWAFQPIRDPDLPPVKDTAWPKNGIDRFVLHKLEEAGLSPAPRADRRTLLRRASYVLTGLPPTPDELAEFEADKDPQAFARVVDRLLASPRYGERWARHWLDVARYADTKGYVFEEERRYPYAYTYRDYVVKAFNDDKPYDDFLIEQIAGDFVATKEDPSALAAMGFLTLGRRFLNNQHDIIDDRIDVLTRGTMALTVACARCHDHKYDPIPIADYYSLYGVFASSEEPEEKPLLGTIPDPERYQQFLRDLRDREKERDEHIQKTEEAHRRKLRETVGTHLLAARDAARLERDKREELARSRQLSPLVVNRWVDALSRWKENPDPLFAAWTAFSELPEESFAEAARAVVAEMQGDDSGRHDPAIVALFADNPPASLQEVVDRYNDAFAKAEAPAIEAFLVSSNAPIALSASELHSLFNVQEGQKKRSLQRAVDVLHATHPGAPPRGMSLADRREPVEPVIFKRGNPRNRGDKVPRQFLALLSGPDRKPFEKGSGRFELARAIASPENPLTARVAVNRVWMHHFGEPLVRTPADFGLRSEPPSHPELLDWLATQFIRGGWSLKSLHRLILLSETWQQSSLASEEALARDPENRLISRQNRRRLDFEAMRDSFLHAANRLDLQMGGHSVEIASRDYALRRAVYGIIERQNLPGLFRTFDFASPDTTTAQRFQTTVPQQALFLLNSPFALDQARAIIARSDVAGQTDPDARVRRLYQILYQREPEPRELELARQFLKLATDLGADAPPRPAWQYGYGKFDEAAGEVRDFKTLPHFTGSAWQGGPQLPDPELGWLILNESGGHPGSRRHGPVIRRWTSPVDGVVKISGRLKHPGEQGDGVRGIIVSSRHKVLGSWQVKHDAADASVASVEVRPGDTLDFVVECLQNENTDSFEWAPQIQIVHGNGALGGSWNARQDFSGPEPDAKPLNPWERYAQVLLISNEVAFVD